MYLWLEERLSLINVCLPKNETLFKRRHPKKSSCHQLILLKMWKIFHLIHALGAGGMGESGIWNGGVLCRWFWGATFSEFVRSFFYSFNLWTLCEILYRTLQTLSHSSHFSPTSKNIKMNTLNKEEECLLKIKLKSNSIHHVQTHLLTIFHEWFKRRVWVQQLMFFRPF